MNHCSCAMWATVGGVIGLWFGVLVFAVLDSDAADPSRLIRHRSGDTASFSKGTTNEVAGGLAFAENVSPSHSQASVNEEDAEERGDYSADEIKPYTMNPPPHHPQTG